MMLVLSRSSSGLLQHSPPSIPCSKVLVHGFTLSCPKPSPSAVSRLVSPLQLSLFSLLTTIRLHSRRKWNLCTGLPRFLDDC